MPLTLQHILTGDQCVPGTTLAGLEIFDVGTDLLEEEITIQRERAPILGNNTIATKKIVQRIVGGEVGLIIHEFL